MRHEPALVDGVAREAAAEMIVDAALRDLRQRQVDRLGGCGIAEAESRAPQQPEELRLRKFRRAPDAAMHRIDRLHQPRRKLGEHRLGRRRTGVVPALRLEPVLQHVGVLPHLVLLVAIDARDFVQTRTKAGRP